jgi:hypothetical protein
VSNKVTVRVPLDRELYYRVNEFVRQTNRNLKRHGGGADATVAGYIAALVSAEWPDPREDAADA